MPHTNIRIPEGGDVFTTVVDSPIGGLTLLAVDQGLMGLLFAATRLVDPAAPGRAVHRPAHPVLRETARQLEAYFSGDRKEFDVPLWLEGTDFQLTVWKSLAGIAYGTTITYGGLAARVGGSGKARAVGGAVGRNPVGILVPCHRVVGAGGGLTGFGGGLKVKAALLDLERGYAA